MYHTSGKTIFCVKSFQANSNYSCSDRSSDLTPLEFFLLVYMNDKVYIDAPQSIQQLKQKIRTATDDIETQMCENIMKNFNKGVRFCKSNPRGHLSDIAFHY